MSAAYWLKKIGLTTAFRSNVSVGTTGRVEADDRTPLESKQVDLLVAIPPDFQAQLREGRPVVYVLAREGDDRSRLVAARVTSVLNRWKKHLKEIRFLRRGLPADFDEPFEVRDLERLNPGSKRGAQGIFDFKARWQSGELRHADLQMAGWVGRLAQRRGTRQPEE